MAYLAVLDHEASKEDPPVGAAFSHQGISCALHYLLHHLFLYHWGNSWGGGVSPHATCIGACVTLTHCFVIL